MNLFDEFKLYNLMKNTRSQMRAGALLIKYCKTLSIAESCTGGLLSSFMTDVAGSSSYIHANFVTYANEAKTQYLGVNEETLEKYGAVSEQTANEMVNGLLDVTGSDFAIATTGIAGPSGGSEQKPVGLVYIGIGSKHSLKVYKYNVDSKLPRTLIKYMFAKHAVDLLCDYLEKYLKDKD